MAAKATLTLCALAGLLQSAFSQYLDPASYVAGYGAPYGWADHSWGYDGLGYGASCGWGNLGWGNLGWGYDGLGYGAAHGWGYDGLYDYPTRGLGYASPAIDFTPTSGGSLVVTSASAIPPTGISIVSDNAYEGILVVAGEVPFVGTTSMEGALPTVGAGAISYGCGSGITAMVSDIASPIVAIAPVIAVPIGPGIGCECGSGVIY